MESILLIDDSKAVTYIVKKFLEKEGYEVRVAQNAHRGLDLLRHAKVDLIIADIMMPGMDGYQLAEIIKKDESLKDIPLIFFTAKGDISDEFHGYMTGAEYYITKPVRKGEMLDKIEKALGKKDKLDTKMLDVKILRGSLNKQTGGKPASASEAETGEDAAGESCEESDEPEEEASAESFEAAAGAEGRADGAKLTPASLKEINNIFGSMIEVMWAFSFDKLLSFENLSVIECAIDKTCLDYPFIGYLSFSEDGIDLSQFKEKARGLPQQRLNAGFTCLMRTFFDVIVDMAEGRDMSGIRICVLGEDPARVASAEQALLLDGYSVKVIPVDGNSVAEQVAKVGPHAVVWVPSGSGDRNIALLRALRSTLSPRIVIVAAGEESLRKAACESKVDVFLPEPWSRLDLLNWLRQRLHSA